MSKFSKARLDYFNTDKLPLDEPAKILFIDVETSGFSHEEDDLLQVGWFADPDNGDPSAYIQGMCYVSGATVKEDAQRINGITQELIDSEGKLPAEIWPKLKDALDWCNVVAFYNAGFDAGFLGRLFGDDWYSACMSKRLLDVLDVVRKPWCWGAWPGNYKLSTMGKLAGVSGFRTHDAMGDAALTSAVWDELPYPARVFALHGEVRREDLNVHFFPDVWRQHLRMSSEKELLKLLGNTVGSDFTAGPWSVTVSKSKRTTTKIPDAFPVPDEWKHTSDVYRVSVKLEEI